jgi:hypothetical protein
MKDMDKTDSKVRIFLELSHPRPIQILSYTPIYPYEKWEPKEMYSKKNSQYYYAFINDKKVIDKFKKSINKKVNLEDIYKEIENAKNGIIMPFEFNGYNIEKLQDFEIIDKPISSLAKTNTENNGSEENKIKNEVNTEEEKYVVLCRFSLKKFGFIQDINTIKKEDIDKLKNYPIVYSLKGGIRFLLALREKELEAEKGENQLPLQTTHIKLKGEDNVSGMPINDMQNLTHKKEDENYKLFKESLEIDGHWFLVNNVKKIEFLSFIKYKEIVLSPNEMKDKNIPPQTGSIVQNTSQNFIRDKFSSSGATTNLSGFVNPNLGDDRQQPFQFSYIIKDLNKFVTIYQNISCIYHHNKNEFVCKSCNMFCCSECILSEGKQNNHFGPEHKIALLDEVMNKFEEDSKALTYRIKALTNIIEDEINEKKNEIENLKKINEDIVKKINDENRKIRNEIKKEEVNRGHILGFLGNEALRILGDYNSKIKYLSFLNKNGDMNSYLINYFLFVKYYQKEIRKNLNVLETKIIETFQKFKKKNDKLNSIIEETEKTL